MRRTLAALFCAVTLSAQTRPADKNELNRMIDELRAAVRGEDWPEASRIAIRINTALLTRNRPQANPLLEFQHLETVAGTEPIRRNPYLARLAKAAFDAGEYTHAAEYAREAIAATGEGVFWWTGDAIHQGNIVLGRLALRRGDVDEARRDLLAAGRTPGSSSLNSTGPNMALASDLLDKGESATVVQYLEECGTFWKGNRGKLAEWIALIKAGIKPDFGANLGY
ncbi:MAG: hypothetical protein JST11_01575 [Acidobacteria bacterium]|nr:hypothetical protein [Acidobacteriota bacterium]